MDNLSITYLHSLGECIEHSDFYDRVIFDISYGHEFLGFHYNPLGFGNLVAVYTGYLSLKALINKNLTYIDFPRFRFSLSRNIKSVIRRSDFEFDIRNILSRACNRSSNNSKHLTYIDHRRRTLHLSTGLINTDPNYLELIISTISYCESSWFLDFGIVIPEHNNCISMGIHVRRGDFKVCKSLDDLSPNHSPEVHSYFPVIDYFLNSNSKLISKVNIYSDCTLTAIKMALYIGSRSDCVIHSASDTGQTTLNKMMLDRVLINSNSTLSTWASILSGNYTIYPANKAVYECDKFANQRFFSFKQIYDFSEDLNFHLADKILSRDC